MNFFQQRIPANKSLLEFFLACIVFSNTWGILVILKISPGLYFQLSLDEFIGVHAYTIGANLVEALIIFLGFGVIAFLAPPRFLTNHYPNKAFVYLGLLYLFLIPFQWMENRLTPVLELFLALGFIISIPILHIMFHKKELLSISSQKFMNRLDVLGWFYLALDLFCWVIIILRNI